MPFIAMRGGDDDAGETSVDRARDQRFELERMLMEADRILMQIVSLALSLIGFGFSINSFFNDAARVASRASERADRDARIFGIFLVLLGLLFLSMGIRTQARYRRTLVWRFGVSAGLRAVIAGRATPTFVTAFLLLMGGLVALSVMLLRWLL